MTGMQRNGSYIPQKQKIENRVDSNQSSALQKHAVAGAGLRPTDSRREHRRENGDRQSDRRFPAVRNDL